MTISLPISASESFQIGVTSSPSPASAPARVIFAQFNASQPAPLPNTVSLDSLLSEFEADQGMAIHMAEARQELAESLYADEPNTFSVLRLRAGLSQSQLAESVGTSQSYIARIEAGKTDPGTDQIARIAEALHAEESAIYQAIRHQRTTREITL